MEHAESVIYRESKKPPRPSPWKAWRDEGWPRPSEGPQSRKAKGNRSECSEVSLGKARLMGWNFATLTPSLQKRIVLSGASPKKAEVSKEKGVMNAHETDFRVSHLLPRLASGEFRDIQYEPDTLPIAHRCTYTPDFRGEDSDGGYSYFEVKGAHRFKEKGVLKLKFAAQTYKEFRFFLCEKKKGEWQVKRIPALAINSVSPEPDEDE